MGERAALGAGRRVRGDRGQARARKNGARAVTIARPTPARSYRPVAQFIAARHPICPASHAADRRTAPDPRHAARVRARRARAERGGLGSRAPFPREALRALGSLGALGVVVPEAWGGAGLDYVSLALALEEIAAGDGATSTIVSVQNSVVCGPIDAFGTDAQKARYLPPLARGEKLGCFCLTEPQTGSDASAITTRAERRGDALRAERRQAVHHDAARTPTSRSCSRVTDKAAGQERHLGVHRRHEDAGLRRRAHRGQARPARVRYRADRVRELRGAGREPARRAKATATGSRSPTSKAGRIGIAAQAVGMARAAFEAALAYARERQAFGKPIVEHQAVNFRLADMATQIEVARQMVWHAAALRDAGEPCLKEASMAKLFASEMAERVALRRDPDPRRLRLRRPIFRSSASTATCASARSTKARATSSGWSSAAACSEAGARSTIARTTIRRRWHHASAWRALRAPRDVRRRFDPPFRNALRRPQSAASRRACRSGKRVSTR